MRRILLVLVALFIGFGSVSAKKRKEVKSDLVGVWQQAGTMDGKLQARPILKIIDADGTFSTMFVYSGNSSGRMTQIGTYKIMNDSIYKETITNHFIRSQEGTTVPIKYRFADDAKEVLILEFENGAGKSVFSEMWLRISAKAIVK
ncbi:MAG: DUF4488 domain-containing protein [Bacteroidaceae bacterium]|nr:DUF4488 domain-containing protein [Bacteroidaceae bacterium]